MTLETYEYQITRESLAYDSITASIELLINFKVTSWGCPARIRYDEDDHPAEGPEVEVISVLEERAGDNEWIPASKDNEEWAWDWADDNVDELMGDASKSGEER